MAQLCSVARLAGLVRRRFLPTLTMSVTLLWPSHMVMATTHGTSLSYPHIDLVEAVIAAPRDFGGDNAAFVKASNWFMDKMLSKRPDELAPHLVCAEWGRGRKALGFLQKTFSPTYIHPVCNSRDHGSCFVVSASPEMFISGVLDAPGLISAVPLHPSLKLSPDLLDHKLEENGYDHHDPYTPLHTTSGKSMKQDNTRGLTIRLTPGALPMHSEHSGANGIIEYLQEDLMTDFDMNANNYWCDTEGSHPEGRGAYLAREWSRAASVVTGLASDRQRSVGSVCGYNRIKLIQVDNDLILVEGMDHLLPKTAVAPKHEETKTACFMGLLSHLAAKLEVLRVTPLQTNELLNAVGSAVVQSATPSSTPFEGTGLNGSGEVIQVVDTGLDETSCFFADDDGLQVEHGHLFHGLRRDPDGSIQGYYADWTLVHANYFPYDMSRRKVVQYIELFNTGDQAEGEGVSFGLDDSFFNFSEYYYGEYLEDDTVLEDDTDDYTWQTTSNSTEDSSTSSYTSTYTWYSSSEHPCVELLEGYYNYYSNDDTSYSYDNSSDSYTDYNTYFFSSGGFHKDKSEGHGTHVAGTAAGNAKGSPYTGSDSVPACAGGCVSPTEIAEYISNGVFDSETNCPAYECDSEGLDSPSCLSDDVIKTLVDNSGIASGAQIAVFDSSFGGNSIYAGWASNFLWNATFGTGAMIHSNSWGSYTECQPRELEFTYDTFMYENPEHLLVFAAGNNGGLKDLLPDGSDCTIGSPALSKNVLAVGSTSAGPSNPTRTGYDGHALYDEYGLYNYTADGYPWICLYPTLGLPSTSTESADIDTLSYFSSYGPTLDGRIKPEVVAPGDQLLSASSDGAADHSCKLLYSSGTSMAAPLVAGAAAIIRQYFKDPAFYVHHLQAKGFCKSGSIFPCSPFGPSAATVKAMLINSANLMGGSTEPNNFRGFGRVHLEAGLPLDSNDPLVLFVAEASLESNGQTKYAFNVNGKAGLDLRASLSWLDIPTTVLSSLHLQQDLDLSVTSPSGDVYTMWTSGAKDAVNVNERVIVPAGSYEDGIYTVTVSTEELLTEFQAYSLIVTGAILAADGM